MTANRPIYAPLAYTNKEIGTKYKYIFHETYFSNETFGGTTKSMQRIKETEIQETQNPSATVLHGRKVSSTKQILPSSHISAFSL